MVYHDLASGPRGNDLLQLNFARDILPMIRHHHEHFDGNGYPDGSRGDAIPELARIISIADALDALTSDRSYRAAVSIEAALETVKIDAGSFFDPLLVAAFSNSRQKVTLDR